MNNSVQSTVTAPVLKAGSAWVAVGVTTIVDAAQLIAAVLAALYTLMLMLEFLWKKFGRPFAESRGWVKRKARRRDDWQG